MSLKSQLPDNDKSAVRLQAGKFAFSVRGMIAPLFLQIGGGLQSRTVADSRRRATREIANLPAALRDDLAFSQNLKHNDI